jgi:hypothetical protein
MCSSPFNKLGFFVPDWQHFDGLDEEEEDRSPNYEAMKKTMESYLEKAVSERDAIDLNERRE